MRIYILADVVAHIFFGLKVQQNGKNDRFDKN